MKFVIPIDRKTIQKNPDAGRTKYKIRIGPDEKTLDIKYKSGLELSYIGFNEGVMRLSTLNITRLKDQDLPQVSDLINEIEIINFNTKSNYDVVHTISPAPDYLYEYQHIDVQCEDCENWFDFNRLEEEYDAYSGCFRENICPNCNTSDCCELEYEKIGKVLEETNNG